MKKEILLYGILMGVLLVVLRLVQYNVIIRDINIEFYAAIVAVIFLIIGAWLGGKLVLKEKSIEKIEGESTITPPKIEHDLSKREYEVLVMMSKGFSNREIADKLFVSLNTIKTHTSNIYLKLNVKRRTQAIKKARDIQLLKQ